MRRRALFTGVAVAALIAAGVGAPAQAAPSRAATTQVSVLHAVPNTPVDVYLDGAKVLNDFKPGTLAGPLTVPAGSHTVSITAATATSSANPVIGPVKVSLVAHRSYTIVAHLTSDGKPTATAYLNTLKSQPSGQGRLIVRHDAAAPAVDVLANGTVSMKNLTNPKQSKLVATAGTYSIAVALAGTTKPVIGPAKVTVKHGYDTIVYAWGSAAKGNLAVAVQSVKTN